MRSKKASGNRVIESLQKAGFQVVGRKGNHVRLKKKTADGVSIITVPLHKELSLGTLKSINRYRKHSTPSEKPSIPEKPHQIKRNISFSDKIKAMSGKEWADHWNVDKAPKYKSRRRKLSLPKIKKPKLSKLNKKNILIPLFLIAILGISIWSIRTGRYAAVLKADLEEKLIVCEEESETASSCLGTCEADLAICQSNISSKVAALGVCEEKKQEETCPSPDVCQQRYIKLKENYIKEICCENPGVYKSYNYENYKVYCQRDERGMFLLEC